ncbi:hypothetical protein [Salinibaculum rarum]|nr:hypothetical protein [Salinibaculum sp. KK48]
MGLTDRLLDAVARWFAPTMDHPAGGGMTGENEADTAESESPESDDA